MESGAISRVVAAPNQAVTRSDSVPTAPSAPVELAPVQVVQPVGEAPAVRIDVPEDRQRLAESISAINRQMSFDYEANEVVVRWTDDQSGDVVSQFPNERALKVRAYWRDQFNAESNRESGGDVLI